MIIFSIIILKVIGNDDEDTADDRAITAVGLLNTLETMLDVVEEEATIMVQLEGIVCKAIAHVLQNRIMDYYEEVLSLLYSVTCSQVSSEMWQALGLIHEVKRLTDTGGGRSMVQKRGLSMVQLCDSRQFFFGKGVSRWYNEIFKKIFLVYITNWG